MNHDDYKHTKIPIHTPLSAQAIVWHPYAWTHCLVVGGSTGERSGLLDNIAADFTAAGWSVERSDSIEKQREIITDTWVLMEQRYEQCMTDPAARDEWDPILLVVEEEYGGVVPTDGVTRTVPDPLHELLRLSRSAKIHVLVCASSPHAELLTGDWSDNLATRIPLDAASRDHQLMKV